MDTEEYDSVVAMMRTWSVLDCTAVGAMEVGPYRSHILQQPPQ